MDTEKIRSIRKAINEIEEILKWNSIDGKNQNALEQISRKIHSINSGIYNHTLREKTGKIQYYAEIIYSDKKHLKQPNARLFLLSDCASIRYYLDDLEFLNKKEN